MASSYLSNATNGWWRNKHRNDPADSDGFHLDCLWLWGFLMDNLSALFSYESSLWLWRTLQPLPCTCLCNWFELLTLYEFWSLLIAELSWPVHVVSLVSMQSKYVVLLVSTPESWQWHARCEWSKVYTSEVLKSYFTQCVCWNLYYLDTLPPYSFIMYSWLYYLVFIWALLCIWAWL